jgi:hypothetical protein
LKLRENLWRSPDTTVACHRLQKKSEQGRRRGLRRSRARSPQDVEQAGRHRDAYGEEELLGAYSTLVGLGLLVFWMFHVMYLVEAGLLATRLSDLLVYLFSMVFPTVTMAVFLAYELLDRRTTERRWTFRVKRFFGRIMFVVVYGLAVVLAITMTTILRGETNAASGAGLLVNQRGADGPHPQMSVHAPPPRGSHEWRVVRAALGGYRLGCDSGKLP